jgi:hypothetical protein
VAKTEWLLTQPDFAERLSVSVSTVKAWRRQGLLVAHRDYTWLPSTRGDPKAGPSDRNLRFLWPQARDAVLAGDAEPTGAPASSETKAKSPAKRPRKAGDGTAGQLTLDLGYRAPS